MSSIDGRRARGDATRGAVLRASVDLASVEGLDGLSIGRLATDLGISKSGLFGHFGSKEELQLATVDHASAIFVQEVVRPAMTAPRGLQRLRALYEAWLSYMERHVFPGGCFFAHTSAEFDSRPGPVHDRLAQAMRDWLGTLERAVRMARDSGELRADVDPGRAAFELHALGLAANWRMELLDDREAFQWAREGAEARLAEWSAASPER